MSERDELRAWLDELRSLTGDDEPLSGILAIARHVRQLTEVAGNITSRLAVLENAALPPVDDPPAPKSKSKTH